MKVIQGDPVILIDGQASLLPSPVQVHIGEPVVWTLAVKHRAADGVPEELKQPLREKMGWVLLDGPQITRTALDDGDVSTQVQWSYMSLRPGSRTPDNYELTLRRGAPLRVELGELEVLGELEESDEAPRELAPIREIEAGPSGHGGFWLGLGVVVILAVVLWRKSRKRRPSETTGAEQDMWAKLKQAQVSDETQAARQNLFDWHRDLRAGVDGLLGENRSALTDVDWLASSRSTPGADSFPWDELQALLGKLEQLKYQETLPGRLTLDEVCTRVRSLATSLEQQRVAVDSEEKGGGAA